MVKNIQTTIMYSTVLIIVFLVGFFVSEYSGCDKDTYRYINPNLVCKEYLVVDKKGYTELKISLEDFIDVQQKQGRASMVSIYFRDLQSGPTLGINEHEKFVPASLLKLPMAMTYFDITNDIPELFTREISFTGNVEKTTQYFPPAYTIEVNEPYTVEHLLETMILYSDNRSYYALRDYLAKISPEVDLLQRTFVDLGIVDPKEFSEETLSTKSYASVFVQLYNNSFFSKSETSEKMLDILARTDFKDGLVAGIPDRVVVAHKFGERSNLPGGQKQLHDCGIVYYTGNPYLLCVMTRGSDFEVLQEVVAEVSRLVYEEFDSRKL